MMDFCKGTQTIEEEASLTSEDLHRNLGDPSA
jgi:hypothetical protein